MCAVSTVDQHQPVVGFDQQHVADHRGAAVFMVPQLRWWTFMPVQRLTQASPLAASASSSPRPIWVTRLAESK